MSKVSSLSVFFPAYNEEKNIGKTVEKALQILPTLVSDYEVIVVNDGSTDSTKVEVEKIIDKNPKVKLISHPKNLGYGAALKTGFYSAKFPLIVYTDADSQFDFSEIKKFLEKIDNAELVIGYRQKRAEGFFRSFNAAGWRFLNFLLFGLRVRDIDCGFKLVKKQVLEKVPKLVSTGATISAEFLVKAKRAGFKISEVPVVHYPRKSGKQTGASLKVIVKAFFELFKLRLNL